MLIRPFNDIAVTGELDLTGFVAGESRELTFNVTTARRALANAQFVARHGLPDVEVTAIRASAGECHVMSEIGGICDFSNLPPDTQVAVTVTWHALEGAAPQEVTVSVSTPGDVTVGNNEVSGNIEVLGPTDLELHVASTAEGAPGHVIEFPPISVVNGSGKAVGTRLEVTLPAGVALVDISAANAICSGTAVLRCDFDALEAHSVSTVNLSLRASAGGSYVSALKLSSLNDTNPANDSGEVTFTISTVKPVAEAQAGGGGSLEWLSLALLGLLALARCAGWTVSSRAQA